MTISQAATLLEKAFAVLNVRYFDGKLPKAIITIQSTPRAYGHFTAFDAWEEDSKGFKEINIGAEKLDRPLPETIATLIHEMVHMYCYENKIQDTSQNGRYHNKRFRDEAEKRDLIISFDKRIGWSVTAPSNKLINFVERQEWQNEITLHRQDKSASGQATGKKKNSTRKYVCPHCGLSIRATKEVNILCGDCNVQMESEL